VKGHRQKWTEAVSHIGGAARAWAAPPWCVATLWPHFISSSDLLKLPGKIRLQELVLSNSENISCVYHFRNTKIAENRELALWRLVNRLVLENA
jgi:hypothetical protein